LQTAFILLRNSHSEPYIFLAVGFLPGTLSHAAEHTDVAMGRLQTFQRFEGMECGFEIKAQAGTGYHAAVFLRHKPRNKGNRIRQR
jgi:hypothetical protein